MNKLLVSFSGGETSAYMAYWIDKNWSSKYDIKYVFANTGEEHEETLKFIDQCSKEWGIEIVWVEAVVHKGRKGTTHKIVDFKSASRNGEPFEDVIKKYGIPNQAYPHCNREMKLAPIHSYIKSIGWKDYKTAVGIREDEIDRVNANRDKLGLIYPLISERPMTKRKVNFWWSNQSFRLNLKGYEGNCKTCWKKADKKLWQLVKDNKKWFDNFAKWESKYSTLVKETRSDKSKPPYYFYRGNRSVRDVIEESKNWHGKIIDDHKETSYQTSILDQEESCDIYAMCGE